MMIINSNDRDAILHLLSQFGTQMPSDSQEEEDEPDASAIEM